MNILFISHRIPYPPNKGDKIRSFNILKYLAEKHTVYLACLIDEKEDLDNIEPLRNITVDVYWEKINPAVKKSACLKYLGGRKPLSVPYFYVTKLQQRIDALLDTIPVDAVFCFSSPTAEYLFRSRHYNGVLQRAIWCMDLIDVDSDKWHQYALAGSIPMKWVYQREAKTLLAYEKRISLEFDSVLLVSKAERDFFKNRIHADNITALSNGVDQEHFQPGFKSNLPKTGPSLVFTGAMDYRPNSEAVQWFANHVLPIVLEKIPSVHFYVVGNRPDRKVKSLNGKNGVNVVGYVKDVRDYIAIADVCVIPLHIARGLQNKVLEAMAMAKPIVCTSQAFEGIEAIPGEHLLVADASAAFARKVTELLDDNTLASKIGSQARRCVEEKYSWQRNLSILDRLFSKNSSNRDKK
jgi:sugar transferase (PEP-CTERM/EpsH1 system associated)